MPLHCGIVLPLRRVNRGFVPRDILDDLKSVLPWRSFLFPSLKLCLHSKSSSVPFLNVLYFATAEIENLFSSKGVLRHGLDRGMRTGTQLVFLLL